ncbi:hypothetical protein J5N97_009018, partial [Dioscorea zingiberensis]
ETTRKESRISLDCELCLIISPLICSSLEFPQSHTFSIRLAGHSCLILLFDLLVLFPFGWNAIGAHLE